MAVTVSIYRNVDAFYFTYSMRMRTQFKLTFFYLTFICEVARRKNYKHGILNVQRILQNLIQGNSTKIVYAT